MMPFGNHDFRELSQNGTLPVSCIRTATEACAQSSAVHLFLLEMEWHSKTRTELTQAKSQLLPFRIGCAECAISSRSGRSLTQKSHVWVGAKLEKFGNT